jgi:hypothetical protein
VQSKNKEEKKEEKKTVKGMPQLDPVELPHACRVHYAEHGLQALALVCNRPLVLVVSSLACKPSVSPSAVRAPLRTVPVAMDRYFRGNF